MALPLYEALPLAEGVTEGEGDTSAVAVARATVGEGGLVAESVRELRGVSLTEAVAELVSEAYRGEPDRVVLPALLLEAQLLPLAVAVGLSAPMLDVPRGEDEGEREPEGVTEGVAELDTDTDGEPDRWALGVSPSEALPQPLAEGDPEKEALGVPVRDADALRDASADCDVRGVSDGDGRVERDCEGEGVALREGLLEGLADEEPQPLREGGAGVREGASEALAPPSWEALALLLEEGERSGEGLLAGEREAAPEREGDAEMEGDADAARGEGVAQFVTEGEAAEEGDAAGDREGEGEGEAVGEAEGDAEAREEAEGEGEPAWGEALVDGERSTAVAEGAALLAEADCVLERESVGKRVSVALAHEERETGSEGEGEREVLVE